MAQCGACSLCCKLLPIPWMDSPAGEWCQFATFGKGCSIHHVKPDKCREFNCAYSQMQKVNVALRPDNCKVVFERAADDVMFGTQHPDYNLTKVAKRQITQFLKNGFSVVIKPVGKKAEVYLAKGQESKKVYKKIEKNYLRKVSRYDGGIIHN